MLAARLEAAGKVYGNGVKTRALAPTTLEIGRGELTFLLGPSGSGKTTLLNLLGGIDRPSEGSVLVEELRLESLDARELTLFRREYVGFVFQFFNLVPTLTLLGLALGVPLAVWVSKAMLNAFSSDLFSLPFVLSASTVAITLSSIFVLVLLAQWPALRRVARSNLADEVRVREG